MITRQKADELIRILGELESHISNLTLSEFLADLPKVPEKLRRNEKTTIPVLAHLADALHFSEGPNRTLLNWVYSLRETLHWGQTYSADDFGPAFLNSYGWTEFIGLRGPIPSEKIACGVLFLGPMTKYPNHSHQAEELYVPLSGTALWQMGNGAWVERAPSEVIHHPSWTPHAMHTGQQPLVALYLWRGGDLKQKSDFGEAVAAST